MKKFIALFVGLFFCMNAFAQVPFFGTSPEKNNIYSYSQLEFVPGSNAQSIFIFSHYGITDRFSAGVEFVSGIESLLQGFNLKYQFVKQDYMNLSIQASTRMNLFDRYRFDHQNISLFINGNITKNLGYISNTYFNVFRDESWTANQYWYLTYSIKWFTPFLGMTNNWIGDFDPDLTIGLAFNVKKVNFYAWGGDLCSGKPKFTVGFDYKFSCKP